MGPRTSLDAVVKRKIPSLRRESNPRNADRSARSPALYPIGILPECLNYSQFRKLILNQVRLEGLIRETNKTLYTLPVISFGLLIPAYLELQYDIPPSSISSKSNSLLPGMEPEHLYDEIPCWRSPATTSTDTHTDTSAC